MIETALFATHGWLAFGLDTPFIVMQHRSDTAMEETTQLRAVQNDAEEACQKVGELRREWWINLELVETVV